MNPIHMSTYNNPRLSLRTTFLAQDHCCLLHLKSSKSDDGWLSLSLHIIVYAAFAPITQWRTRHILCGTSPYLTPLETSSHHYLECSFREASNLPFKWTTKLIWASISHRLPHSATLKKQPVWKHLNVLSIPRAFLTSKTLKSLFSFQFIYTFPRW